MEGDFEGYVKGSIQRLVHCTTGDLRCAEKAFGPFARPSADLQMALDRILEDPILWIRVNASRIGLNQALSEKPGRYCRSRTTNMCTFPGKELISLGCKDFRKLPCRTHLYSLQKFLKTRFDAVP